MHNLPLVSIALCTYNGEKYLEEQLNSLLQQTYNNIELIIVDDCSSDCTIKILEKYASKDNRIKVYVNQNNLGYNKNFERALTLCKGDYMAISDQDDIWSLDKIQLLVDNIGSNALIYSDSLLIDHNGNSLNKTRLEKRVYYEGNDPRVLSIFNIILGHSILFKASLLKNALPLPDGVIYDWWLGLVAANSDGIGVCKKALTSYRQHECNSSKDWSKRTRNEELLFIQKLAEGVLSLRELKHRDFFEKLNIVVKKKIQCRLYLGLLFFLIRNRKVITTIFNRSELSKLNHLRTI